MNFIFIDICTKRYPVVTFRIIRIFTVTTAICVRQLFRRVRPDFSPTFESVSKQKKTNIYIVQGYCSDDSVRDIIIVIRARRTWLPAKNHITVLRQLMYNVRKINKTCNFKHGQRI